MVLLLSLSLSTIVVALCRRVLPPRGNAQPPLDPPSYIHNIEFSLGALTPLVLYVRIYRQNDVASSRRRRGATS